MQWEVHSCFYRPIPYSPVVVKGTSVNTIMQYAHGGHEKGNFTWWHGVLLHED